MISIRVVPRYQISHQKHLKFWLFQQLGQNEIVWRSDRPTYSICHCCCYVLSVYRFRSENTHGSQAQILYLVIGSQVILHTGDPDLGRPNGPRVRTTQVT